MRNRARSSSIAAVLLALASMGCGGERRGRGGDAGGVGDAGTPLEDGALPPDRDGGRDGGGGPTDGGLVVSPDGGTLDAGTTPDAGPTDAGVDRSVLRVSVPFPVMSWDVDASGRVVAAGRDSVGGDPYLAVYCAGPPGRVIRMAEETPSSALVRVDRVTGDIYVIYSATTGGATAYAIRWVNSACDAALSPPAEAFDAEFTSEGFQAEVPLALDVADSGDAFVVSEYAGTYRLTRYLGGSRREQRDIGSCDPALRPSLAVSLALDRPSGTGALVCGPFRSFPDPQLYVRRFGASLALDPGWTAIPGTEGVSFESQDAVMTESGVVAIWWADRVATTTLQRMLTTLTPANTIRAQWTIGTPLVSLSGLDSFVRERGTVDDVLFVDRQAGAVARYTLDGAPIGAPVTSAATRSSDVAADAADRSYVADGGDIVRNLFLLPAP